MKKLMIAACAVALAVSAQAATSKWYNWNVSTADGAALTGPSGVSTTGTAYMFINSKIDQAEMWADILASEGSSWDTWAAQAEAEISLNNGAVVNDEDQTFARVQSYYTKNAHDLFVVFKDGDNYFFDMVQDLNGVTSEAGMAYDLEMAFGKDAVYGKVDWQGDSPYGGAGWYSTAAVPEPTSGLLLLLGVAGLALRRRRA